MKIKYQLLAVTSAAKFFLTAQTVRADGTEALGLPAGITIAPGTDIIVAGTGMITQPAQIDIDIPTGASVKQVLLYWEGQSVGATGDATIEINGNEVLGALIGGPTQFFSTASGDIYSSTYRIDITNLGLIHSGANSLNLTGLDFGWANNGAGVLVVIDDGSFLADIQIRDGNDLAYFELPPTLDTTVAQTYSFAPASVDRTAKLALFFSSVEGDISGGGFRPSVIDVTVGGTTTEYDNILNSDDGQEWDTVVLEVEIPANADSLTVQALSEDNLESGGTPASFAWNTAALSIQHNKTCKFDHCDKDEYKHCEDKHLKYSKQNFFKKLKKH